MADFPDPPAGTSLTDAMVAIRDILIDAGVPAVVDPADLSIPGAIVYPNMVDYDTLGAGVGWYELTVDLVLVAGVGSAMATLDQLSQLLARVRNLWAVGEARAVTATLANQSPDPLPALQLSVTVQVQPEE